MTTPDDYSPDDLIQKMEEAASKKKLLNEIEEFIDNDDSNDGTEGIFDKDKFNETLETALKNDPKFINTCIETIDSILENNNGFSEEKEENLRNLRRNLVFLKEDIFNEKYDGVKDIEEEEFISLCNKKSLTDEEVKQIVKYSKNEGGLVVLEDIESITDTQANYLQDVPSLYISDGILTENQKKILSHRNQ